MLITEEYRQLNQKLHNDNAGYGTSGHRYAHIVKLLSCVHKTTDILDYGCGKKTLQQALNLPITNYDPCIPGLDQKPGPHDLVACTDVLEHIEPECLEEVLADLKRCTRKIAFLLIATRPAKKFLADGRNAHLIQEDQAWWKERLEKHFKILQTIDGRGEFGVICE